MSKIISQKEARQLTLASQKLVGPALEPVEIIEHLGYVQIDTISVVERAHHHTIWLRNRKYKPEDLDKLVQDRKVFEYWSHAASYLPMKEYRFTLPMKLEFQKKKSSWFPKDIKMMDSVLKRIQSEGPLRSKDFKTTKKSNSGWWDWKPAKLALERLFLEGKLEVSYREKFQKVYDLPERVIPNSVNKIFPKENEMIRYLIKRALRHHGLATSGEIAYLGKSEIKTKVSIELVKMVSRKEVQEVNIKGIEETYYMITGSLENLPKANSKILILSPFDNLVIQRKKLLAFFDFDYQIECYVPEKKRKFGYFCLPVFKGSQPIARMDCKADRKNRILEIHSTHYEKKVNKSKEQARIESNLAVFAKFNGCNSVLFL